MRTIGSEQLYWLQIASNTMFFIVMAAVIYRALARIPVKARRWRSLRIAESFKKRNVPPWMLRALLVSAKKVEEKRQMLQGSGISWDAALYESFRRLSVLGLIAVIATGYAGFRHPAVVGYMNPIYVLLFGVCSIIFALFDKKILAYVKEQRSHRIVKEIYTISHQLLYYHESRMNLHTKLSRCAPQMRTVRSAFQLMMNEWYHDAEAAITKFKVRLGTDESYSFAETLNALRLNEHEDYYGLLKQRIQDYKEKMELIRESRKETVSYMLFVLAGLPILNTFRVFMYPWIAEGQRLFNSIN